ncbi:CPBP family intramembrane glutamic endopeptidase [Micromonospora sp. M71_S20]|uniref:CPBP family intramembrane glutamic endopeptidase n=1 Tax=Micromonospora sp. M71_S20 TaxID=592872 RepID=UPI0013153651|nr:type II CAAX endopeptidase family protein [Micromonospora sp. M71_S20]
MNAALELTTHVLVATLLAIILVGTGLGVRYRDRFIQQLTADPRRRTRFYRDFIVQSWVTAAFVPLIAFVSADLSVIDLGWTWPSGDGIDYLLAAYMLVTTTVGALRARRRTRRGEIIPIPVGTALIVPQTPHERRLSVAVAATAGITEEAVYRGLLIAAGTRLYDLPLALVVTASLALFVAAHAYQGRKGMIGVAILGALFTAIYLISGSLLLAIMVHIWQNLVALLLLPVRPSGPQPINDAGIQPGVETTGHAQREPAATTDEEPPQPAPRHVLRPAVPD